MIARDWRTVANLVTSIRLFLSPVALVFILVLPGDFWWQMGVAFLVLLIALSDRLDGYLARSRNQVTELGGRLDPLVDKVLVVPIVIALSFRASEVQGLVIIAAVVIVVREIIVEILRYLGRVGPASSIGKVKMVAQIVMIVVLLIPIKGEQVWQPVLTTGLLWLLLQTVVITVAVVLTLISLIVYITTPREGEEEK